MLSEGRTGFGKLSLPWAIKFFQFHNECICRVCYNRVWTQLHRTRERNVPPSQRVAFLRRISGPMLWTLHRKFNFHFHFTLKNNLSNICLSFLRRMFISETSPSRAPKLQRKLVSTAYQCLIYQACVAVDSRCSSTYVFISCSLCPDCSYTSLK